MFDEFVFESQRVADKYRVHGPFPQDHVLGVICVLAALAPAFPAADALIFEALAVQFETARMAAVAVFRQVAVFLHLLRTHRAVADARGAGHDVLLGGHPLFSLLLAYPLGLVGPTSVFPFAAGLAVQAHLGVGL